MVTDRHGSIHLKTLNVIVFVVSANPSTIPEGHLIKLDLGVSSDVLPLLLCMTGLGEISSAVQLRSLT